VARGDLTARFLDVADRQVEPVADLLQSLSGILHDMIQFAVTTSQKPGNGSDLGPKRTEMSGFTNYIGE
jgi:hypothetical protein